ncbi:DUF803 domain-containing protein, partial [Toxoplasma gondii GAB2-2007-GAL-DOM2]
VHTRGSDARRRSRLRSRQCSRPHELHRTHCERHHCG